MDEIIEMMFQEMAIALGFHTWYESEEEWEGMEEIMVLVGLPQDEVHDYFCEMAYDL